MSEANMKWVRIAPGHYETDQSYNGYRYRITRNAPGWPYALRYLWDKDSTGTWRTPLSYSQTTIEKCKRIAAKHNVQPRQRWVFAGRDDKGLRFVPADERPDSTFKRAAYLDPVELAPLRPAIRPFQLPTPQETS